MISDIPLWAKYLTLSGKTQNFFELVHICRPFCYHAYPFISQSQNFLILINAASNHSLALPTAAALAPAHAGRDHGWLDSSAPGQ